MKTGIKALIGVIALIATLILASIEKKPEKAEPPKMPEWNYVEIISTRDYISTDGPNKTMYHIGPCEKVVDIKKKDDVFIMGDTYVFCTKNLLKERKSWLSEAQLKEELKKLEPYAEIIFPK